MLACAAGRTPDTTHVVLRGTESEPSVVTYGPVERPNELLAKLVSIYETCRRTPLPLFEDVSRGFVEDLRKGSARALANARKALAKRREWQPHLDYVIGPGDPFEDESWSRAFGETAQEVYGPLFDHRSES
jgi:hypothetical protein